MHVFLRLLSFSPFQQSGGGLLVLHRSYTSCCSGGRYIEYTCSRDICCKCCTTCRQGTDRQFARGLIREGAIKPVRNLPKGNCSPPRFLLWHNIPFCGALTIQMHNHSGCAVSTTHIAACLRQMGNKATIVVGRTRPNRTVLLGAIVSMSLLKCLQFGHESGSSLSSTVWAVKKPEGKNGKSAGVDPPQGLAATQQLKG